ncbi:MAG TPA: DNA (cytosine-5-)-methyltransferase, partial [Actinoplanes sp.]|nr:DNA (cytosine-5-)-methyltransferase [Actinoplanes sp.]
MRVGSLCTGYGGIEMGLTLAGVDVDLRWFAEADPALGPVHAARFPPDVPNLGDIKTVDWSAVAPVDLVTAGFPCQPVSAAGRQLGERDERWLWPWIADALAALRPKAFLLENVRNLVSIQKGELWAGILDDLGRLGYSVRWLTLGACHVGAAHHRHRVFALATQVGYETDQVERVITTPCGAKGATILPTPAASAYGSNQGGAAGRVGPVRRSLDGLARHDLLPTPRASDHEFGGRQLRPDGRTPGGYGADLIDLAASALLPTPTTRDGDGRGTGDAGYWDRRQRTGRTNGFPLDATVALLPSPRASDGINGGPGQRGSSGDLAMSSAVQPEHWGRFAGAVTRHARIFGDPPAPTEPNRNGAPRLAPAFAEWLMCLPAGHVTGPLDRKAALKAIGNGVCPPQVAAAWALLTQPIIDTSLALGVRSETMTTTTNDEIKAIQDREAQARGRVIEATMTLGVTVDPALIQAAMMELAAVWREQAAWWEASGKRGGKGTAKELIQAAGRLAGFAVGLSTRGVEMPEPRTQADYAEIGARAAGYASVAD